MKQTTFADNVFTATAPVESLPCQTCKVLVRRKSIDPLMKSCNAFAKLLFLALFATALGAVTANSASRYSVATGNWNSTTTWSTTSGGGSGASVPASGDTVTIEGGCTVTLDANTAATASSITISAGATFATANTSTVNATTIAINGTYLNGSSGAITVSTMTVNNGGTYQHNINGGTIHTAIWNSGSTCLITGATTTEPGGLNQSFHHFSWNCPNQINDVSLGGNPTTIRGDMSIMNTSASQLQLKSSSGTATTTVSGDFKQSGGTFVLKSYGTGTETLTLKGFSLTGGTFYMNAFGASVLNVGGDFAVTGAGLFTRGDNSTAAVNFIGTTPQNFTMSGSMLGTIDYTVNNGATLLMGAYPLTGAGTFTLNSGAGLGIGHANGINGNIAVSGNKTLSMSANYIYNGTTAQAAGALLPATINSLTVNNTADAVTLSQFTTVTTSVTLASGAKLSLPSGTSTATALVIAGVNKRRGVWGSSDSGAANQDNTHFAGTGVLNVTSGPTSSPSSTALASSPNPSTYGGPVTFTATVTGSGPTPTGTITFKEGSTTLGSDTLNASGVATIAISTLSAAGSPHTITAVYGGDGNFDASSGSTTLQVFPKLSGSSASGSLSGYKGGTIKVRFVAKDADGKGLATNEVQLATTDGGSSFAYAIGVPPDTATLCLKPRFFLRGSIPVPAAVGTDNAVTLTITNTFVGGDADNNNQVDGNDYAWTRALWGKTSNDQYDVNGDGKVDADDFPDLNGDGVIDAQDYALLKAGWYQKGEEE
jgi:hypothetical protein